MGGDQVGYGDAGWAWALVSVCTSFGTFWGGRLSLVIPFVYVFGKVMGLTIRFRGDGAGVVPCVNTLSKKLPNIYFHLSDYGGAGR